MRHFWIAGLLLSACNNPTAPANRGCGEEMRTIAEAKVALGVMEAASIPFLMGQNPWIFENETIYFDSSSGQCVVERRSSP